MTGNSATANGNSNLEIAQSNQDLLMTKAKRKKRTWITVGVITTIVAALVIAAIVILVKSDPKSEPRISDKPSLSLEDVLHGRLNPSTFNATWTSDKDLLYTNSDGDLVIRNIATRTIRNILPSNDPLMTSAFQFDLSNDNKYLMVIYDYQKLYRHSYRAKHMLIELETGKRYALAGSGNEPTNNLQLALWSPVGNAIVFVHNNNIYYKSTANNDDVQKIASGSDFIYNGVPDWVYEEEVFSSNKALWFSPDGKKIAYGRFDDTLTPIMVVPIYGEPGSMLYQYPRANIVKYPKAGSNNPTVSLHVVNLENLEAKKLDPPIHLVQSEPILSAVAWAKNDELTAIWMNRVQNNASIVSYKIADPLTTNIIKELHQVNGWLELFSAPQFSADGSKLILILSQDQGGKLGSFRHIVMLALEEDAIENALTKGAFVVTEIISWDHQNNLIYYLANTANDSAVQHLYSVNPDTKEIKCLSCHLKSHKGTSCLYNTADFSKDHSYYVLTCAGPDVPEIAIYSTKDSKKLLEWDNNDELVELVRDKNLPTIKKMTFDIEDGFKAQVSLRLPPNLDTSGNTKYPMLVNVYGGPDSYQVIDKFGLDWGSYLASNKSIIYATIDGRGSGLKGDKILFSGYRHLGTVEIFDQINVTRLIQESLKYVDGSRMAIWGWSYGGYASGMALAMDTKGVFKCGISVAPVTDWALYDSIYTERFMGLPRFDDNLKGYREAQLFSKYEGLRDKQYFLIHGTYDDNVHYQQSMLWAKTLEQKDILFRQLSYTDEDHGLGLVRPHLYHSLENFLDECFIEKENE